MRQRVIGLVASLLVALGVLTAGAGTASAESYGYIRWSNNCGSPQMFSIIYAGGGKSGTLVVQDTNVPVGVTRTQKVQSGYQYWVTARGGWATVTVYDVPGKVQTVVVRAC